MGDDSTTCAEILRGLGAGDRFSLARALSELERLSPVGRALAASLATHVKGSLVIGITGPPGAGKSTLVNALIGAYRARDARVGVLAVDPSSPISGGAILGDRIRMTQAHDDAGVFVRSLAARGALGGLSPPAVRMLDAFDAAGYDPILIETVGTGQSEIDVATIADVRIVVAAPGLGDDVQAMKGGVLEIADILVVNKGDHPGADATLLQLKSAQRLRADGTQTPVLKTTATTGEGMAALMVAIEHLQGGILARPLAERRRTRARYLIRAAAIELVQARTKSAQRLLATLEDDVLTGRLSPDEAALVLMQHG